MPFRTFILNNLWLKLLSLVLATLMWFAIHPSGSEHRFPQAFFSNRLKTREFRCSVVIMTAPANRVLFTVQPTGVTVKLEGEEAALKNLGAESIQAYIRPTELPNLNGLCPVEVVVPREVALKSIVPGQVLVRSAASTNQLTL